MDDFDARVARLQHLEPFTVQRLNAAGVPEDWFAVTGAIVAELVISPVRYEEQLALVSAQVGYWSRVSAQARRVLAVRERAYRAWQAAQYNAALTPDGDGWRKPTEKAIESGYRQHPDYPRYNEAIERAREAVEAVDGIVEAFKTQRVALRAVGERRLEQSLNPTRVGERYPR